MTSWRLPLHMTVSCFPCFLKVLYRALVMGLLGC